MARFTHDDDDDELDDNGEVIHGSIVPWVRLGTVAHNGLLDTVLPNQHFSGEGSNFSYCIRAQQDSSDFNKSFPQRKRFVQQFVLQSFFVFLIVQFIWRYMPPPPAPYSSWNHYADEMKTSISNGIVLVSYVSFGLIKNALQDIRYHGQTLTRFIANEIQASQTKSLYNVDFRRLWRRTPCTFRLPLVDLKRKESTPIHSSITEDFMKLEISGQDKAIHAIARAIDARAHENRLDDTYSRRKPLFLIFSGSDGVGKSHTAQTLARMLLGHCSGVHDRILILNGLDYSSSFDDNVTNVCIEEECPQQGHTASLEDIVIKHIENYESGNIIILEHVEVMTPTSIRRLGDMIQKSHGKLLVKDSNSCRTVSLENTIFILTTDWGSDWIFTLIRKHGHIMDIPYRQLQSAIKLDLSNYIGDYMIQNIIPFYPLSQSDLESIMKQKIMNLSDRHKNEYWKRLEVEDSVYQHFTDPNYVEYLELTTTTLSTTHSPGFIFAKRGAHDLDENILLQAVKALMTRGYFNRSTKIAHLDYLQVSNEVVISWCSESHDCQVEWSGVLDE